MIRKYKDGDIDTVVSIWRRASERAHPFLSKAFLDQEDENMRNIYLTVAEKGPLKVAVFKENRMGRRFYDAYGFRENDAFIHEATGQKTLRMTFWAKEKKQCH